MSFKGRGGELSAKDILDYIHNTEPNLIRPNTEDVLSAALKRFVKEKNEQNERNRESSLNGMISRSFV